MPHIVFDKFNKELVTPLKKRVMLHLISLQSRIILRKNKEK